MKWSTLLPARHRAVLESEMVWLATLVVILSGLASETLSGTAPLQILLRKEVIQPQVPLRLPCYDFIPITNHTFGT